MKHNCTEYEGPVYAREIEVERNGNNLDTYRIEVHTCRICGHRWTVGRWQI